MQKRPALSRRQFLSFSGRASIAGLATVAVPNIFLNRTFAASGSNPSEFIRVGFIGVGNQGTGNLKKLLKNAVAVCDVDSNHLEAAKKLVEEKNGRSCATFKDYRELLERKDIDAVVVTTPDHWHALPSIHACQAGKDVYCEKPLTLTIAEGQAMVRAARHYNRIVQTGSQQRSDAKFLQACEYVRNGRIGKIKRVLVGLNGVNWTKDPAVPDSAPPPELDYSMWLGPAPERPYNTHRVHYYFRFFWDYSGGQMTNWGAHHLDIAQWALGRDTSGPVEISATGAFDPEKRYEVPNRFEITYRYDDGVIIECRSPDAQVSALIPAKKEQALGLLQNKDRFTGCIFEGEKGLLYVNRGVVRVWPAQIFDKPITESDTRLYASTNHFENWLACIKSRKLPICDVAIGHRSATTCHLGNLAIRAGRKLRWNPESERFIDDREADTWIDKKYRAPWSLPKVG